MKLCHRDFTKTLSFSKVLFYFQQQDGQNMSFISLDFVVFFAVFFSVYFFLPHKGKLLWLFLSSLFFYGYFKWEYVFLILFSLILDYSVARIMGRTEAKPARKLLLLISLSANLGLLFFFKYFRYDLLLSFSFNFFNV